MVGFCKECLPLYRVSVVCGSRVVAGHTIPRPASLRTTLQQQPPPFVATAAVVTVQALQPTFVCIGMH